MLRGSKRSKNESVAPKEEEVVYEVIRDGFGRVWRSAGVGDKIQFFYNRHKTSSISSIV
jgi:hypothetical protein